jgi:hypothetical protein
MAEHNRAAQPCPASQKAEMAYSAEGVGASFFVGTHILEPFKSF